MPDPASLDEALLLSRLDALVRSGQVRLAIDRSKLSHIDFPLAVEADANRWIYPLVAVTGLAFWQAGPTAGVAVLGASLFIYFTLGRRDVVRRLDRRIRERGLASVDTWRRLWRFGGVILTGPDGTEHRGPADSWMQLVRELAPPKTAMTSGRVDPVSESQSNSNT